MTHLTPLVSSLRGRIFLASALLAVLACSVALFFVNRRVTNEAERSLQREILVSGAIVDQLRTTRTETYTITARLIADSPTLKAAVTTDAPTVQNELRKYGPLFNAANLLLVTDNKGSVMATSGEASARVIVCTPGAGFSPWTVTSRGLGGGGGAPGSEGVDGPAGCVLAGLRGIEHAVHERVRQGRVLRRRGLGGEIIEPDDQPMAITQVREQWTFIARPEPNRVQQRLPAVGSSRIEGRIRGFCPSQKGRATLYAPRSTGTG